MSALKLVYLCTHNACRSVLCEVISRELASDRLAVASAGSAPAGRIHPLTLKVLQARGCDVDTLRSQGIDEFRAFDPDVVITVCDRAAGEACPLWLGGALKVHWGLPDPTALEGDQEQQLAAFAPVIATIEARLEALLARPFESMGRNELEQLMQAIGDSR
jgi:arsenate reductase